MLYKIPYTIEKDKIINVIDIETYGKDVLTPYCCIISYKKKIKVGYGYDCIKKILSWIFYNCSNETVFYAHNLNFDGCLILNFLNKDIELEKTHTILRGGEMYSICLKNNFKKIIFKCSAKILPMELSEIAKKLNIPQKLDFDHSIVNNSLVNDHSFKEMAITYCKRDVEITCNFLSKIFFSTYGFIDNWYNVYSISGLALKIFDKNFNIFKTPLNLSEELDCVIRPSYYGGRCEVFGNPRKNEKIFHFDFSGMYTNRLKEKFPYTPFLFEEKIEKIEKPGFYSIKVKSDLELPILPYRDKKSGKLLFPNGIFSGLYWYEEINLFIKNGGKILDIYFAYTFTKEGFLFKDFAENCEKLRKESNMNKIIWKLIPNSFVGRLGLKKEENITKIIDDKDYNPVVLDVISDKKINDKWIVKIKSKNTMKNTVSGNVIYPSIITSKARVLWWNSAKEVMKKKGRLFYCDTDSIFAGFKKDVSNERHGEIFWDTQKEDTLIDDACFATSKVYCIKYDNKNTTKIKGISKKNLNNLTIEDFKNLFYKNKKKSFKTISFDKNFLNIKISEISKIIDFGGYDKRVFNKRKDDTKPLWIEE